MATYAELYDLQKTENDFRNKITVAVVKGAQNLLSGTPSDPQQKFAAAVFRKPDRYGVMATRSVLATYSDLDTVQILGATDAQIQTAVDTVIPALVVAEGA